MMRADLLAGIAAIALATGATAANAPRANVHSSAQTRTAIAAALADPRRADATKDDARRKSAAVLQFAGVGPGDTVVDFLPGGAAYWTRIFSTAVGPSGKVYALWPQASAERAVKPIADIKAMNLANVTPLAGDVATLGPVDLVWTVQNYHDVANRGGAEALLALDKAVLAALKPGGTYVVIDHAAKPGSGLAETNTLHRIDPAAVKAAVVKAGFKFEGQSNVLRNPADDHSKGVTDPAIRGTTDQFVLKFRKPR